MGTDPRQVPAFKEFIQERFRRCLDLYLVPRALKQRMNVSRLAAVPVILATARAAFSCRPSRCDA